MRYLRYLLVFLPLAVLAELLHWDALLIFVFSCIALIPLAGLLGEATEELAIQTGPKLGGLLSRLTIEHMARRPDCCFRRFERPPVC